MLEITSVSSSHLKSVAALVDDYRQFYGEESDPIRAQEYLEDRIETNASFIFCALLGKRAVGFTQLFPSFSTVKLARVLIFNDLYVDTACRNQGVATALIENAITFAKKNGFAAIRLATQKDNLSAKKLYQRFGWKRNIAFDYYSLSTASS